MIGCAVAIVFSCLAGSIWYSAKFPIGRLWLKRNFPGKTEADVAKDSGPAMGLSIVASIFTNLLLRFILIDFFHATLLIDAVKFGAGLSCLTTLLEFPHILFTRRYFDLFLIDQVYNLIVTVGGALCIVYFA